MERRLKREEVRTIEVLPQRGMSKRAIARQLAVPARADRVEGARPDECPGMQ
jgi:hypothetical protein